MLYSSDAKSELSVNGNAVAATSSDNVKLPLPGYSRKKLALRIDAAIWLLAGTALALWCPLAHLWEYMEFCLSAVAIMLYCRSVLFTFWCGNEKVGPKLK